MSHDKLFKSILRSFGALVTRFGDVVAFAAKPFGDAVAGAPVHEKPHFVTCTASRESRAMTACAYAMQARMSSGFKSG